MNTTEHSGASRALYRDKWKPINDMSEVAVGHPFCVVINVVSVIALYELSQSNMSIQWQSFTNYR